MPAPRRLAERVVDRAAHRPERERLEWGKIGQPAHGELPRPRAAKAEAEKASRCYKARVEAGRHAAPRRAGGALCAERQVVRFEHVGLRYGLGPEVLRDLTFRIDERSFQFLTGPSGAGKTSLLRLLFLSLRPTRGLVTLFGHDVATLSKDALATLRRRIGIVFQDFRLLDHMTTFENVALPLRVIGQAEDSYREEVVELLSWVGLGDRISALPPVLSGGEKQRAAIARAVIARPQLLLADEPTGNVDPNLAKRLLRLFVELNKSGTSVVIATHDIALMDQFDARRLVLHEGRVHVYD
jgi:cell division transport system ATP-binding protein